MRRGRPSPPRRLLLAVGGSIAALVSCARPADAVPPLRVAAAVSLAPALREALDAYRRERPAVEIELTTGASAVLAQQARRGAPIDLLISAAAEDVQRLIDEGLADPAWRRPVASNRLVVVAPCGSRVPERLADLADPAFARIALGNPATAPVGRYARESLERLGLWELLLPRLVFGEHARQTLDYVARKEVDAAVVYRTDARLLPDRVCAGPDVPAGLHHGVSYEGVVLLRTPRPGPPRELLSWLSAPGGGAVLARHGFLPPADAPL